MKQVINPPVTTLKLFSDCAIKVEDISIAYVSKSQNHHFNCIQFSKIVSRKEYIFAKDLNASI